MLYQTIKFSKRKRQSSSRRHHHHPCSIMMLASLYILCCVSTTVLIFSLLLPYSNAIPQQQPSLTSSSTTTLSKIKKKIQIDNNNNNNNNNKSNIFSKKQKKKKNKKKYHHYKLKRGTRTTGAGSHSIKNRSIFYNDDDDDISKETQNALSGQLVTTKKTKKKKKKKKTNKSENNDEKEKEKKGTISAKLTSQQLLIQLPLSKQEQSKSKKEYVTIALDAIHLSTSDKPFPYGIRAQIIQQQQQQQQTNKTNNNNNNSDDDSTSEKKYKKYKSDYIPIEGIYGIYNLPSGPHILLVTQSECIYSSSVLNLKRILSLEIVPLPFFHNKKQQEQQQQELLNTLTLAQQREEYRQLQLLRRSFREHNLFFSNKGKEDIIMKDVTQTLQRSFVSHSFSHSSSQENKKKKEEYIWWQSLLQPSSSSSSNNDNKDDETTTTKNNKSEYKYRPDARFFWNQEQISPFLEHVTTPTSPTTTTTTTPPLHLNNPYSLLLSKTMFPVTSASIHIQTNLPLPKKKEEEEGHCYYDELLLSRRSKYRTGTRFTKRGCDDYGHVANFAESEQICIIYNKKNKKEEEEEEPKEIYSHVQTRGSIPIRWSSPADIKTYRPLVRIGIDPMAHARGLTFHLVEQLALYSSSSVVGEAAGDDEGEEKLVFVNLVDKHGDQGRLGTAFDRVLDAVLDVYTTGNGGSATATTTASSDNINKKKNEKSSIPLQLLSNIYKHQIKHIWYDFHAECSKGRWNNLSTLLNQVSPALDSQGYFSVIPNNNNKKKEKKKNDDDNWKILSLQNGIIRTNCMDCLDRTNVVQSVFGRYVLYRMLHERIGLRQQQRQQLNKQKQQKVERTMPIEQVISYRQNPLSLPFVTGEVAHRLIWADNADDISKLYAGTNALKGDFTRTGKRTKRGALDDGMNSLQRYYLNNFIDAERQEGMDLLVGYSDFTAAAAGGGGSSTGAASRETQKEESGDDNNNGGGSSLLEATRALLLRGSADFSGGSSHHRHRNKDNNEDRQSRNLGLRWLPGDLKDHVKGSATATTTTVLTPSLKKEGDFGSEEEKDHHKAKQWKDAIGGDGSMIGDASRRTTAAALALEAIDERAASDRPWWVLEEEDDDDEEEIEVREMERKKTSMDSTKTLTKKKEKRTAMSSRTGENLLATSGPTGGQVLGSLFAVMRAPVTSAVVLLCLLSPGLSAAMNKGENI